MATKIDYISYGGKNGTEFACQENLRILQETLNGKVNLRFVEKIPKKGDVLYVHMNPNMYNLGFFKSLSPHSYKKKIVFVVWECEDVPQFWVDALKGLDVWTASEFCKKALSKKGIKSEVVSHSVRPIEPNEVEKNDKEFTFLTVFDSHSQILRKNPMAVIDSFKMAFGENRKVKLIVKGANLTRAERGFFREQQQINITLKEDYLPAAEYRKLFFKSDCFVSLHKAEGFGLHLAEAHLCRLPVISTGYSGNLDFQNEDNSWLVEYEREAVKVPYFKRMMEKEKTFWANPNKEHAAEQMKSVVKDNIDKAERGFNEVSKFCSSDRVSKIIQKLCDF